MLYIDILGFREMTLSEPRKVARVYAILDKLNVHQHPNFETIVFSDTILPSATFHSMRECGVAGETVA